MVARAGDRADGIKEFLTGDISSVYLVYNEFQSVDRRSAWSSSSCCRFRARRPRRRGTSTIDYLFEPDPEQLLNALLPFHVAVQVTRALLESSAAEHAARMQSMDSATRNAKEMVDRLTLYMNKVRQAAITREIIEVVSGAQSV